MVSNGRPCRVLKRNRNARWFMDQVNNAILGRFPFYIVVFHHSKERIAIIINIPISWFWFVNRNVFNFFYFFTALYFFGHRFITIYIISIFENNIFYLSIKIGIDHALKHAKKWSGPSDLSIIYAPYKGATKNIFLTNLYTEFVHNPVNK